MGVPYLILCSENDDLAPYQVICNFAQRLKELGGDVKLLTMNGSPHVGLFLNFNSMVNHDHIISHIAAETILVVL